MADREISGPNVPVAPNVLEFLVNFDAGGGVRAGVGRANTDTVAAALAPGMTEVSDGLGGSFAISFLKRTRAFLMADEADTGTIVGGIPLYGVVGDGLHDDTIGFQAQVNKACNNGLTLVIPANMKIRLTATITTPPGKPLRLIGFGSSMHDGQYQSVSGPSPVGKGSWLMFDHAGAGIVPAHGTRTTANIVPVNADNYFADFGVIRPQDTPGVGWAPRVTDYDFRFDWCSVLMERVNFLSSYKGVWVNGGCPGDIVIDKCKGQFFKEGIFVNSCYSQLVVPDFRSWSFWSSDASVLAYMTSNLTLITLCRCDDPMIGSVFGFIGNTILKIDWFAGSGSGVAALPAGTTYGASIGLIFGDAFVHTLVTTSASYGATATITQLKAAQDSILTSADPLILIDGSLNNITIKDYMPLGLARGSYAMVVGNLNTLQFDRVQEEGNFNSYTPPGGSAGGSLLAGFKEAGTNCQINIRAYGYGASNTYGAARFAGNVNVTPTSGKVTGSTDASGLATIGHSVGQTPSFANFSSVICATPCNILLTSMDASNLYLKFVNATGGALASTTVTFRWTAGMGSG